MKRPPRLIAAALVTLSLACARDHVKGLTATVTAPPELAFGSISVGQHKSLPLVISNSAIYNVDLLGIDLTPPYSLKAPAPLTIPATGSVTVNIVFTPVAEAPFDQTLTIRINTSDTPTVTVALSGTGLSAAACTATSCGTGLACCGDACVDTQTSPDHCGGCTACAAGDTCASGACVPASCSSSSCGAGQSCCGDQCVDTQHDNAHCGGCNACLGNLICQNGGCVEPPACDDVTAPCGAGQKCCNHACVAVGAGGLCPCTGPGNVTTFGIGSIIIPMDACFQRGEDVATLPAYCTKNAKQTIDDAPLKAYGLVFFLLRHQVTVYMAINPQKTTIDGVDLSFSGFTSRTSPVHRYDWASASEVALTEPSQVQVDYRGAPFLIDSSEHDKVLALLKSDPDFARFRDPAQGGGSITLHVATRAFQTAVAKSISAVPSRIALLVPPGDSAPVNILVAYLKSAGLDFPGAGGTPGAPGQIYDKLEEADFLPGYDQSALKSGGYKLLWSPHWEGSGSQLEAQLGTIGAFVDAGNDLFAECAAIGTLEGFATGFNGGGTAPGSAATRFMTSSGMAGNSLPGRSGPFTGPFNFGGLTSPFAQRGDFPFSGYSGAITDFHSFPGSYNPGVVEYISTSDGSGNTDLYTSIDLHGQGKGTVVYLSGHDYSDTGSNAGEVGVTAGSRLVLNTMFSLGTNNVCAP